MTPSSHRSRATSVAATTNAGRAASWTRAKSSRGLWWSMRPIHLMRSSYRWMAKAFRSPMIILDQIWGMKPQTFNQKLILFKKNKPSYLTIEYRWVVLTLCRFRSSPQYLLLSQLFNKCLFLCISQWAWPEFCRHKSLLAHKAIFSMGGKETRLSTLNRNMRFRQLRGSRQEIYNWMLLTRCKCQSCSAPSRPCWVRHSSWWTILATEWSALLHWVLGLLISYKCSSWLSRLQ